MDPAIVRFALWVVGLGLVSSGGYITRDVGTGMILAGGYLFISLAMKAR